MVVPVLLSRGSWMQLATLVDRQEFCLEITASKNIGRMLGKTSPAMFRSHPCGKSESKEHVTLPCWNSVFGDSSRNRIDRQWQVLASHWQWYSWSKCKLFISFCHWKLTHELSHGERPKVTIIIRIERMRHTARCVLPVRSVPSKSDFHDWISDVPKICCELESPEPLIEANILA